MKVKEFKLNAMLNYSNQSIESFLSLCEQAVTCMTDDEHVKYHLKNALNELVVNSMEHGYNKDSGQVSICIRQEKNQIIFEIKDYGKGLSKKKLDLNRQTSTYKDLSSRGWGLSILNQMSSTFDITHNIPNGTIIRLTIPI